MKLVNPSLNLDFQELEDGSLLIVESSSLFYKIVLGLKNQIENNIGDFILSKDFKPLDMRKNSLLIIDPLSFDPNEKKIENEINKLVLQEALDEGHYEETSKIISILEEYTDTLAFDFNGNITTKKEVEISSVIKMLSFQVETYCETFQGKLFESLLAFNKYLGINLFFFVNLLNFLEREEFEELSLSLKREGISLFLIEAKEPKYKIDCFNKVIIDSDLCQF